MSKIFHRLNWHFIDGARMSNVKLPYGLTN